MCKIQVICVLLLCVCGYVNGDQKVPCYFIFGDSLSDAGNNNNLNTAAKANYAPYGIDFAGHNATGRFTNGLTSVDVLGELMGFKDFIQPFTTASGSDLLKGVNYASGAAGIRNETGSHLGDRIWFNQQVQNHNSTITKLQGLVTGPVNESLNKCLYTVNIGSNDYINNYFMPENYPTKNTFTPDQYAQELIIHYEQQLKTIYSLGARKIAVFGVGQIGCTPGEISKNKATKCITEMNQAVDIFNKKLQSLIDSLNENLVGAKFTFINISAIETALPSLVGTSFGSSCCKTRSDFQCQASSSPCEIRLLHMFMDGVHPTANVNTLLATLAFNSINTQFVYPVSVNQLIAT